MVRGWKSEKIEKILISIICVYLEKWKSRGMKNFFIWLRKNKMVENVVGINLISHPYFIIYEIIF